MSTFTTIASLARLTDEYRLKTARLKAADKGHRHCQAGCAEPVRLKRLSLPYRPNESGDAQRACEEGNELVLDEPIEGGAQAAPMHLPPRRVDLEISVVGAPGDIGDYIDLPQRRLMEAHIVAVCEGLGFLGPVQKIQWLYAVLLKKLFKARMADIADAINIDEEACEVELLLIFDHHGIAAENAVSLLNGSKSIVDVTHVPVEVLHASVRAYVSEKLIEHLPLELIVVLADVVERHVLPFCDLMN